jgi:hypothetical protein
VKVRCKEVILETRKELIPLLRGCAGVDRLIVRSTDGRPAAAYDHYVPLMSLPALFNLMPSILPGRAPYIVAAPEKIDRWRNGLISSKLKIGLVWSGRPQHTNDRNRSCALMELLPLLRMKGANFFGLQKGAGAEQIQSLPDGISFTPLGEELNDFSDTAAVIANLDLVISVDTAVAHLAGAMAKPVWVMIPFIPDWRWGMQRHDTDWYPTMRLFRQPRFKDWSSVVKRLCAELIPWLQTGRTTAERTVHADQHL